MADLLGNVDDYSTSVPKRTKSLKRRIDDKSHLFPRKRASSPPMRNLSILNRPTGSRTPGETKQEIHSSPPSVSNADMDYSDGGIMDLDTDIPDPPTPLLGNSTQHIEEEEEFESKPLTGGTISAKTVNITSTRLGRLKHLTIPGKTPLHDGESSPIHDTFNSREWAQVNNSLNISETPSTLSFGKIQSHEALEQDGSIRFFWIDYVEVNGVLGLFGKVKTLRGYVSAFCKVEGILRNLYFLPRETRFRAGNTTNEQVQMEDVYEEVSNLFTKLKITQWKSKPTTRKYAFEIPGIPAQCDYLKVLCPSDNLTGETFSLVFGTNTALFEQFVLYRKIMGPCWLTIKEPNLSAAQNSSWCKLEFGVSDPECITPIDDNVPPPTFTLTSLALRTVMDHKANKQEIVLASLRIFENVSLDDPTPAEKLPCSTFTVVRPLRTVFPAGFEAQVKSHRGVIKLEKTEASLLNSKIQQIDPDFLIGHNIENVDYCTLLARMKERKTHNWHRIGRLKRSEWPKGYGRTGFSFADRGIIAGRLIGDLANDLGKSLIKATSWSLSELVQLQLGIKRTDVDAEKTMSNSTQSGRGMMDWLEHCEVDTYYIAAIALKVQMLPLTRQLTNLAGNSWARTLAGTRAERNEFILLHEFHRNKYICPDKQRGKKLAIKEDEEDDPEVAASSKKKEKYKGGLVFEPAKGLYDKIILVMDFNSLYPSIIQEYNICFTTVDRSEFVETSDNMPELPGREIPLGILPRLIATLVGRRRQVKSLMKDKNATPVQLSQWDIKQQALKLTANSMYGCLGYTKSRFYARALAMLTTFKGREILTNTKALAEDTMQLQVIYGDTDSVMINTNVDTFPDAMRIGNEFKKLVNERYRLLEIDIDNVYQRLLLHAKKKYAALNLVDVGGKLEPKIDIKGLDMKRREYCNLSKDASHYILSQILSGEQTEVVVEKIHEYLRELASKMRHGDFTFHKYIIHTRMGKNPEDYPGGRTMPHIQVALKRKARGQPVRIGDVIAYIITGEDDSTHVADRAVPKEDFEKPNHGLIIDYNYYLGHQILPPIDRLCAPIEGTDAMRIADCLGLDPVKYKTTSITQAEVEIQPLEALISDEERFRNTVKFEVLCNSCHEKTLFEGLAKSTNMITPRGFVCSCGAALTLLTISAQVEHQLRAQIALYYEAWLICDDTSCANRTRQISVYGRRCLSKGCRGRMNYEYSDKMLYNQLLYIESLWDVDRAKPDKESKSTGINVLTYDTEAKIAAVGLLAEHNRVGFEKIGNIVKGYLAKCGRRYVDLASLFGFME
ncbi:DNA polymerase alpha catalytic subunit [Neolecta irregularis DAH-3]|uniref:DNA polymerase n=1 Tax=Neolecta irregularis (strain DAH-3) TaxID=1198029 RepID=A0A1U7LVC1_NEOID|nr:DNA polymerase alpha catalytic subunit [Neolecta irregularis DAH-3]|eukprot:OLL26607.1 DNA polymerase alpha catalytic subunit [Neolecta irregularis DAH-3]